MNKTPLVSILIPTYNQEQFVAESLDSALDQTYPNIEIIIHNFASTDNTQKILRQYSDPRLKTLHSKKNHGMVPSWNEIMKNAKGEYIKFLASDDLLHPTCVEELVRAAQMNKNASLITCKRDIIDENGKKISSLAYARKNTTDNGLSHARWILTTLIENKIGEPTAVLFRTRDVEKVGNFDPELHNFVDFEYWIRLLTLGDLVYINKSLCAFRAHDHSSTSRAISTGSFIDDIFHIIAKYYTPEIMPTYNLSIRDGKTLRRHKIADLLKNMKDLIVSGKTDRANMYLSRLRKHVPILEILAVLVVSPFLHIQTEQAEVLEIFD